MPAPISPPGTCSVGVRMQRRLFLAAGGALAGFGLWRVRGHATGLDPLADFALTGQLTQGGWARGKAPLDTARLLFGGREVRLAPDRSFFIAFDRDAPPRAELVAEMNDGGASKGQFAIAPRSWQIERIPIGPRPGSAPSEEFARRREAELAQIKAARLRDNAVMAGGRHSSIRYSGGFPAGSARSGSTTARREPIIRAWTSPPGPAEHPLSPRLTEW